MRAVLCLLMLALAGCTSEPVTQSETTPADEPELDSTSTTPATVPELQLAVIAVMDCPLEDLVIHASGGGVRGVTSTRCLFADLSIPDGAVSFDAALTWDATFNQDDLGFRVSDQTQCGADGGDGCDLGTATGASPVFLEVPDFQLDGHELADLDIYPIGFAVEPDWALEVRFFGYI